MTKKKFFHLQIRILSRTRDLALYRVEADKCRTTILLLASSYQHDSHTINPWVYGFRITNNLGMATN